MSRVATTQQTQSTQKLPKKIATTTSTTSTTSTTAAKATNPSYSDSYPSTSASLGGSSLDSSAIEDTNNTNSGNSDNSGNTNEIGNPSVLNEVRSVVDEYAGPESLHGRRLSEIGNSDNIKLLFLDVDGVLNYENSDERLCLPHMKRLKKIIDLTSCKVVLSTSWRISPKRKERLLNGLKNDANIDVDNVVIGSTPSFRGQYGYHHRPLEIYEFLTHNEELYVYNNYKVVSWVAIDDLELSEYNKTIMQGHFVKTDMKTGITDNDVDIAIKILNSEDLKEHTRLRSLHQEIFGSQMDPKVLGTPTPTATPTPTTEDSKDENISSISSLINPSFAKVTNLEEKEDMNKIERIKIKLLFLNIDGVLNTEKYISQVNNGMSPDHLVRLGKILESTKCKIVFSTNRRLQTLNKEKALKQLERKISDKFIKEYFAGDTPHLQYQCRPFEIQRFLDDIETHPFLIKIKSNTNTNTNQTNTNGTTTATTTETTDSTDTKQTSKDTNSSSNNTEPNVDSNSDSNSNSNNNVSMKKVFFDVISWCAVDDIPLDKMNTECWNIMNGRFIKTDPKFGMTDDNTNDIITILNEETGRTKHKPTNSTNINDNNSNNSNNNNGSIQNGNGKQ